MKLTQGNLNQLKELRTLIDEEMEDVEDYENIDFNDLFEALFASVVVEEIKHQIAFLQDIEYE